MKKLTILTIAILLISPAAFSQLKAGKQDNTKHIVLNSCISKPVTIHFKTGTCPFCGMTLNMSQKEQLKLQATAAYSCPMHSDLSKNNKQGKSNLSLKEEMKMKVVNITDHQIKTAKPGIQSATCCGKDQVVSHTK